jgi:nitrogen fixation-related uncharacterized protein
MGIALILLFLFLVGPAAVLWGVDSRDDGPRRRPDA